MQQDHPEAHGTAPAPPHASPGARASGQADFGYRSVPLADKQGMVDEVFHRVARRYDLMNDLMSAGLHRMWKSELVAAANPPRHGRSFDVVDIAGGTGDIAFRLVERGAGVRVTVLDINAEMLAVGRARAADRGYSQAVSFVQGNAENLPLPARSMDAATIAFGIRNVPRIDVALAEAFRVLRPGGQFLCLEFSAVDTPGLDRLYDIYSFNVIPQLGRLIVGDEEPYRYLVESIRRFPRPPVFAEMLRKAGFARVKWREMTGGIAVLHSGWRL